MLLRRQSETARRNAGVRTHSSFGRSGESIQSFDLLIDNVYLAEASYNANLGQFRTYPCLC